MQSHKRGGGGLPFTEMGLQVNMHSNYISVWSQKEREKKGKMEGKALN